MKHQASELPLGKPQTRRRTSKFAPLIALTVLLTIPLYYPSIRDSSKKLYETSRVYESLEDRIRSTLDINSPTNDDDEFKPSSLNSLLNDTPPNGNNVIKPCLEQGVDSPQCHGGGGSGDMAVSRHEVAAPEKKHAKGSRKTPRRGRRNIPKDSRGEDNKKQVTSKSTERTIVRSYLLDEEKCDLFTGEWVPNPEGPYYTNATCDAIQEHQNCLKFGRPDRGFLKWRWKPDDCELPIFDPTQFFALVRGKSIACVGDHMQSSICLLSRMEYVVSYNYLVDLSDPLTKTDGTVQRNTTSMIPYLVKTTKTDPNDDKRPFNLYLDEFDPHWTSKIVSYDYVIIIYVGHWFFRPSYFYLNNCLVGCLYCPESNVNHLTSHFSYRRAFRTALRAINEALNFNGVAFLRTFAPSHFEGGPCDKGGDCMRTRPFKRNETVLKDYSLETYLIQMEELRIAQKAGRLNGGRFRVFDATKLMLLRPDGHPSKYGHWPVADQTWANDCVHWCLPGPIDSWNHFLQELLKREIGDTSSR